jgi:hypothetical protein
MEISTNGPWIKGNRVNQSHRNLRRPGSLWPAPIDPFQEHRQLCPSQQDGSFSSLRPHESTLLKTFGKDAKTITIKPENLDGIAAPSAKDEYVA